NIMLANNICDIEDDFVNKRYTLPIQIGRKKALFVYDALYALCYADIAVFLVLGYLPIFSLLSFITLFMLYKNIKAFHALQTKKDTFILTVQNFMLLMVPLILSLFIGYLYNTFI
ncbi:MAG: 1,4-dihydroxy-2-naphthoate polyprenyltransferase, partial [Clostridia bacterium]|nr:1,4-dihydroxy-2-naphthoate polyprenyltransferase [Clostridia bacterium]